MQGGYSPTINHFGHSHPLALVRASSTHHGYSPKCSACRSKLASGWTYVCSTVGCGGFSIHAWCAALPQAITHPGHFNSNHRLTLLTTPAHQSGLFLCDGCGCNGDGYSYRCSSPSCNFDLHIVCAARPLTTSHPSHSHQLGLVFEPPYKNKGFRCNLCWKEGGSHWLYRCGRCNFDTHVGCVADVSYQSPQPSPSWPQPHPQPGLTAPSLPVIYSQTPTAPPAIGVSYSQPPMGVGNYSQPPAAAPAFGAAMVGAAAQGIGQGAVQQVAQMMVPNLNGGGSSGGTGPTGGNDSGIGNTGGDGGFSSLFDFS